MKKVIFALAMIAFCLDASALSRSKVREYARFLSDRMAYELDLTSMQYNDCYEINYDFIDAVGDLLDDVVYGFASAVDDYYRYLDYRNEDLSYVLTSSQYARFMNSESFYRPFCIYDGSWAFRPYMVYTNRTHFYMSTPIGFSIYIGGHARRHFSHGFYIDKYHHGPRHDFAPIRHHVHFNDFHRHDFGPVRSGHVGVGRPPHRDPHPSMRPGNIRPNNPRPNVRPDAGHRPNNRPQARPDHGNNRPQARPDRDHNRPQAQPGQNNNRPQVRPDGGNNRPQAKPQQSPLQKGGGGGISRHGRR